jgi:hypothetical protein
MRDVESHLAGKLAWAANGETVVRSTVTVDQAKVRIPPTDKNNVNDIRPLQ